MRAIVTGMLVMVGVLGSGLPPTWSQMASAQEGSGDPGMTGHRTAPDMTRGMREMMRGTEMAGPGSHGSAGHEGPLISLMLIWKDQLGLSADQERSLRELRASFEKESIKRTAEIDVAELEVKGLLEADKVDVAKVEALAKKIALLRADLRVARIKTLEAGKAALTAEQMGKFKKLAHESMMGGTGMRMMGPGMSPMHPGTR